jgi:hypothetical protein
MIVLVDFTRFCGQRAPTEPVSINPEHIAAVCESAVSVTSSKVGPGARIMLASGASIDVMESRAEVVEILEELAADEDEGDPAPIAN